MRTKLILATVCCALLADVPTFADTQTLASGSFTSKSMKIQQFVGQINLDQVDNVPLTFNFENGNFQWVRVFLADSTDASAGSNAQPHGLMIINEASFKSGPKVTLDVTNKLRRGQTVLLVRGAGMPGSTFKWSLSTVTGMKITMVEPRSVTAGGVMNLTGQGFKSVVSQNVVDVTGRYNKATGKILDATETSLKVQIPETLPSGDYTITVTAGGTKSNPVNMSIGGAPELTGCSNQGTRSTFSVTFYGKNFSPKASDNEVTIGSQKAEVTSSTKESITVTVPYFPEADGSPFFNPPRPMECSVKVSKLPAKGTCTLYIGPQPW